VASLSGRRQRVLQLQAAALLAFLVVIYGLALFNAPAIAAAFGRGL